MIKADVERLLAAHADELRRMHVAKLEVFGSIARDEAGVDSDIDLLVDFDAPVDLFDFVAARDRLSALLGVEVDLVTRPALRPQLRDRILSEAVAVYGASFNAAA
ncbi:DNA polymerase beta domain [Rhodospirillaceae bacterium LM-1]|nr:DNA polymerase beta domain [Rhodospirillaceae bacterium LM-1]